MSTGAPIRAPRPDICVDVTLSILRKYFIIKQVYS